MLKISLSIRAKIHGHCSYFFSSSVFFQLRFNLNPTVYCVSLILDGSIRAELLNPHLHGSLIISVVHQVGIKTKVAPVHLYFRIIIFIFGGRFIRSFLRTTFRIHA